MTAWRTVVFLEDQALNVEVGETGGGGNVAEDGGEDGGLEGSLDGGTVEVEEDDAAQLVKHALTPNPSPGRRGERSRIIP